MASLRLPTLLLVVGLAILSDLAFRPLWNLGVATPDPPLLLILWLALHDRRRRLHLVVFLIALTRASLGLTSLIAAWSPLALAAELIVFSRHFFDLRPFYFRFPVVAATVAIHVAVTDLLLRRHLGTGIGSNIALGALASTLAAVLFFPVLQATRPLLRSPEYPLNPGAKR